MTNEKNASDLIRYLGGDDSALNASSPTAELIRANQKNQLETPPFSALGAVRRKAETLSSAGQKNALLRWLPAMALAATIAIITPVIYMLQPERISLAEMPENKSMELKSGFSVQSPGFHLKAATAADVKYTRRGEEEHFTVRSGRIDIEMYGEKKKKWFHLPGITFTNLGTVFSVNATNGHGDIQLKKGKLLAVFADGSRKMYTAPAEITADGKITEAEKFDSRLAIETPIEEKPDDNIKEEKPVTKPKKHPRLGSNVILKLKNGDQLTGKLIGAAGGKYRVKKGDSKLTVPVKDTISIRKQ